MPPTRPMTLQDVLKGMQAQIDRLSNPIPQSAQLIDQILVSSDSFGTVDGKTVTATTALTGWGTAEWNASYWA